MAIGKKQLLHLFKLVYAGQLSSATAMEMALGKIASPKDPAAKEGAVASVEDVPKVIESSNTSAAAPDDSKAAKPGSILKSVREILGTAVEIEQKADELAATAVTAPAVSVCNTSLFDYFGRRIPPLGMKESQSTPGSQQLAIPKLESESDLAQRLAYFQLAFETAPELDFFAEFQKLKAAVAADKRIANLLNGVCLPIILPRVEGHGFDYDRDFPKIFLAAAERTHDVLYSGVPFGHGYVGYNGRADERIKVVDNSHRHLLVRMFRGDFVALYFPAALHGFSTYAQREQMADPNLPATLHLSGGVDVMTAVAMYPDILGCDYDYPVIIDMAALQCENDRCSLSFKNRGACVVRCNLDIAHERLFGGLVFCLE